MSEWKRSTFCESAACIEVKNVPTGVVIRSSRFVQMKLGFTTAEWESFLAGVKNNEFDLDEL